MTEHLSCPRCTQPLVEGFIADRSSANEVKVPFFVEGAPEETFWSGLKIKGRAKYRVATFRCSGCGYLESYARTPDES